MISDQLTILPCCQVTSKFQNCASCEYFVRPDSICTARGQLQNAIECSFSLTGDDKTVGNQKKLPAVLEESSSTESQISGKRQRKPPGQWWMSSTEGTDVTEQHSMAKKLRLSPAQSKQSPAKKKKDENLKPVPSSSQKTSPVREKMPKQTQSRGQVRAKPRKTKSSQEEIVKTNAEQVDVQEEQQQQNVLDSDPPISSPLLLPLRDHSSSSGEIM